MKSVLLIEDDRSIAALLSFILKHEGWSSKALHDGLEAKSWIESGSIPSLVVLDVMLPRADGFELLEAIRKNPHWDNVPVIMLTCRGNEQDISRAFQMGATAYILKPFQPDDLKAKIRSLLKDVL